MSGVSKPDQAQNNSTDASNNISPRTLNTKAAQRRDENQYWGLKLTEAIRDNNQENVKGIIKNRLTSINERDKEGQTPLHVACATGNFEMVKFLIKKKAAVNIVDKNGDTPLQRASRSAYLDVCEFLLEHGADPMYNINTNSATTPLHCLARINTPAKMQKNLQVISMMIEKGADINAQTRNGITPLHACSETGVLEIVDLLLSSGASVNLTDANEEDPLHYAVKAGHSEVARTLMLHGADPLAKGKNGTSVDIAEAAGFNETLIILTNKSIRDIGKSQALATFNKLMQPWVKINRMGRRIDWIIDFSNKGVQHFPNIKQIMLKHLFNMLSTTLAQLKRRPTPNLDHTNIPRAKSDGQLAQSSSKVAQIFGLDNSEDSEEFIQRACVEGQEALHLTEKATQVLGISVSEVTVAYNKQPKRGKSTALLLKQESRESTTPMKRRRSSGVIPNKDNIDISEGTATNEKQPSSVMIVTSRVKTPSMLLKTSPVSPASSKRLTIDESKNRLISELSLRLSMSGDESDNTNSPKSAITTPHTDRSAPSTNINSPHSDRTVNESRSAPNSGRTGMDSATDSPIHERSSAKENRKKLRNSVMFNLQVLERELKEIERNKLTDEDLDLLMRKTSTASARRPKLSNTQLVKDSNNNNNSLENSENTEQKNCAVNDADPQQQKLQLKKAKLSLSENSVLVQRHSGISEEHATIIASIDHKEKSPREQSLDPNTYLKCINMANNIISDLSPNAFMFPLLHNALEILDLSNNLLENLPPEINLLKKLQQLSVQRNFLKELPKELGELKYLRILYVYNNFLEDVPEEITKCKNLKTIHLQNNKLSSLPLELASLALEDLQLDGNPCVVNDECPIDLATASTKDILSWMEKERKREKKSKTSKNSGSGSANPKRKSSVRTKQNVITPNTEQKFESLLADPKVNQSFRIFLEKEYASENLLFYNAVEEYKLQIQETPHMGFDIALSIYTDFVNTETAGSKEINLPNEMRENLMTIFEKSKRKLSTVRKSVIGGIVSGSVFDTAQRFVADLLRFDHFKRFLQSDYFKH